MNNPHDYYQTDIRLDHDGSFYDLTVEVNRRTDEYEVLDVREVWYDLEINDWDEATTDMSGDEFDGGEIMDCILWKRKYLDN